jgi:hydroxypyruvate isomerase
MRVSANLGFLYADLPVTDRVVAAALDGFDAVEFHWPYDVPPEQLRETLTAGGIQGHSINTRRGNLDAGDFGLAAVPGRQDEARAGIAEAVDYAARAGLSAVHVMAGRAEGEAAERIYVENLRVACREAEGHGLTVLIEPLNLRDVPGYFLTGTDHARRLVAAVGHPNLRIMYDVYHMQIMQGDHVRTMQGLGDLVGHIQIASVPDRTEPDRGEVDIRWLLNQIAYSGRVGAEYHPTRAPGDWLRDFRSSS